MKKLFKQLIGASALLAFAGSLQAIPTLSLSDGDGHTGSGTSATGAASFNGSVGDWTVNVDSGIGSPPFPLLGTATHPYLDLNIGGPTTYNGGTGFGAAGSVLTVNWTVDNEFGPLTGILLTDSGGTLHGGITLTINTIVNGVTLDSLHFTTPGAFSASNSGLANIAAGSTIEIQAILTGTVGTAGTASGDSQTTVPDGGSTMALLGFGLVSISALRRKLGK